MNQNWNDLVQAFDGVNKLAQYAEISPATMYRMVRGETMGTQEQRQRIASLAEMAELSPPIPVVYEPAVTDSDRLILLWLGRNIRGNKTAPRTFMERYAKRLGQESLQALLETGDPEDDIHLAAAALLGL